MKNGILLTTLLSAALYDAGVEAELILNDLAPHGNLGHEAAASIQTFVKRILLPN